MANDTLVASAPKIVSKAAPKGFAPHGFASISEIGWLPSRNIREDYGTEQEMKALDEAMYPGWGQAFPCETTHLSDEDKASVISHRMARWSMLKEQAKANADMAVRLRVFETLFVEKGKLLEPKVLGNTGNRRGSRWEDIQFKRLKDQLEILDQIPVYYKEHASEASRREAQMFENFGRENAAKTLNGREIVRACHLFFKVGYKESDLMKTGLKRGICQKLHRLYQLDAAFPGIKMVERILRPDTDDTSIPWGSLDKEVLKELLDAREKEGADKKNRPITTAAEVEKYVVGLKGGIKPSKVMSKDDMIELGKNNNVKVVKDLVEAYSTNNKDVLFKVTENADLLNLAMECYDKGKAKEAVGLLRKLLS